MEFEKVLNRILELIKKRNLSEKYVLGELGISTSFLSEWKKGKIKSPQFEKIVLFSIFFNVSMDYLTFGETKFSDLSTDERDIINVYRQLDEKDKYKMQGMFELKLEELESKKEKSLYSETSSNIA